MGTSARRSGWQWGAVRDVVGAVTAEVLLPLGLELEAGPAVGAVELAALEEAPGLGGGGTCWRWWS